MSPIKHRNSLSRGCADADRGEGVMIAWADWDLPEDEIKSISSGALPVPAPAAISREFCELAVDAVKNTRNKVLKGRKCYGK